MKHISTLLIATSLLVACATESNNNGIIRDGLLTVPNVKNQWTYVSLTEGCVVGSCALSDTAGQRQWAQRQDWDMAACNGMIRTNGGDSGLGQGAIAVSGKDYEATEANESANYATDRDSVEIW